MKTNKSKLLAIVMLLMFSMACKKDNTEYNCYFYTNMQDLSGKLSLYVNNQFKGSLPTLLVDFKDFPDSLKSKAIYLKLKSGTYDIRVSDDTGINKVLSKMSFTKNKTSSSGSAGGTGVAVKGSDMVVQLFY